MIRRTEPTTSNRPRHVDEVGTVSSTFIVYSKRYIGVVYLVCRWIDSKIKKNACSLIEKLLTIHEYYVSALPSVELANQPFARRACYLSSRDDEDVID
jgi:hypothetical protein